MSELYETITKGRLFVFAGKMTIMARRVIEL